MPHLESELLKEPFVFAGFVSESNQKKIPIGFKQRRFLPFFQFFFYISNRFASKSRITEDIFVHQTFLKVQINAVSEEKDEVRSINRVTQGSLSTVLALNGYN